jgi:GT2 family glycosyltransferase
MNCLAALRVTVDRLLSERDVEYVLLDDASDTAENITPLFLEFRKQLTSNVQIVRFRVRQHYVGAFAHGLSMARGDHVLFVSNDMLMTPAFLRTVLAVSAVDSRIGIVRGRSPYCDSLPQYSIPMHPATPPRGLEDIIAFSEFVSSYHGLHFHDDDVLSGDCVLVKRSVIDAIGVLDTRFYGYFGDPDYGLRAQRAGFRLVCALGAWLHHEGGGHLTADIAAARISRHEAAASRQGLVAQAFETFRQKWGAAVGNSYAADKPPADQLGLRVLRTGRDDSDFIPPLLPDPSICDVL